MKAWPVLAIVLVQSFLCLAHWFMYETWVAFWWPTAAPTSMALRIAFALLSFAFISASMLSFRFSSAPVRLLYHSVAVWMGLANFLFVGACIAWLVDLILRLAVPTPQRLADRPYVGGALLAAAVVTAVYGLMNARIVRVHRLLVELPNLPVCWRGRQALLISDMHLGHVNGVSFARQIVAKARDLNPPLGAFFVDGNHEEYGGAAHFEDAVRATGIRVLHNECVAVDGVRIVGVPYGPAAYPLHMRAFLEALGLKDGAPSILLNHVPNRLPLAEHAGVSLQLSGHTHGGGQIFPYNLITRRAFGKFTYGLQRFGEMQVYTSSGAGSWGPPMRVGTHSEIVLLTFA